MNESSRRPFYLVDVFAEEKYAGNQLAVVLQARGLSEGEMQRIAKEMNFSETSFVLSEQERRGGYDVRIFTPEGEVPFAGHPTLGTAFVIQEAILPHPAWQVVLNLKVGQIPVTFTSGAEGSGVLWMKQVQPGFGRVLGPEQVAPVLNLKPAEVDSRFPIQEVSTGLPALIVPLRTIEAVKRARTDREKYFELLRGMEARAILVFCPETYHSENDLNVRVFVDCYGIPEDPATGSANGCLAGYLVKHRYFGQGRVDLRVEQGYEIGRPSLLLLRAEEEDQGLNVSVGGRVVMVARGELL